MSHVIDTRHSGGEYVILGRSLTLPASNEEVIQGAEPLIGSIRYNPEKARVEVYAVVSNGIYEWQFIGDSAGSSPFLRTSGGVLNGNLFMREGSRILAETGTAQFPSISFEKAQSTGLSAQPSGALQISANNNLAMTVTDAQVKVDVTLDAANFRTQVGTVDSLYTQTGTINDLTVNTVSVEPAAEDYDELVSEISMMTNGQEWVISHAPSNALQFEYETSVMVSFFNDGVVEADTFRGTVASSGADLAERYRADAVYEPGTVLVIGGEYEVTMSTKYADSALAGIVSTTPGVKINQDAGTDATHPYIALKGRVPCKVIGPIRKGQSLVTSDVPGHAQATTSRDVPASLLVGKALQDFEGNGLGIIEVMVF